MVRMCENLQKVNPRITGSVQSSIMKSLINGKVDYGSEVVLFPDYMYERMDMV